jgi:hypothetical protein
MAERIVRKLIDDIDSTEIPEGKGERVEFALRGVTYQIDLNEANVVKLEKALAPYIESAVKVGGARGGARRSKKGTSPAPAPEEQATIRAWAKKNGQKVSSRGRIPTDVVEAYKAAHPGSPPALPSSRARRRPGIGRDTPKRGIPK